MENRLENVEKLLRVICSNTAQLNRRSNWCEATLAVLDYIREGRGFDSASGVIIDLISGD